MDFGLSEKVAVVTGAAGGIGSATVSALLEEGCKVLAVDAAEDEIAAMARRSGDALAAHVADVTDEAAAAGISRAAVSRFGRLDILVTCAGITGRMDAPPLEDASTAEWERIVAINLGGTFLTARGAMPIMAEQGWGRVITVGSLSGQIGGLNAGPGYAASKAGVLGLTRSLAQRGGPDGITVNCVHPGTIETAMTAVLDPAALETRARATPMGRNGLPEDVAAAILFLACEQAGFITGVHIDVNGGVYMG